jgi:NhaP-type Na+/H+ or K+/H+ antiporter
MMRNLKIRLLGVGLILVFGFLVYVNWQNLITEGRYSLKLATFGPVGFVAGFYLFFFPGKGGKPQTTRDKIVVIVVFVIGVAVGLINWYLMDPSAFGR